MTLLLAFLLMLYSTVSAQSNTSCTGKPNQHPLITEEPVFVNSTTHGQLFRIDGNGTIDPPLWIIHLYGNYYEMGLAYGQLMSQQINDLSNQTLEWLFNNINQYDSFLSPQEQEMIDTIGTYGFLDYVFDESQIFIPNKYIELMTGIADGTGIPYMQVVRFQMIPEAIKAKCSMVGAWNKAININDGYSLIQLRALDNGEESPLPNFPTLAFYHPEDNEEFVYNSLAYSGFVGAFTGISSSMLGICEKYWNDCECEESRRGEPWNFVLQDILEYSKTKQDAMNYLNSTNRTCAIYIGVGDDDTNEFNVLTYSYENITVYTDSNYPQYPGHPRIDDVLYIDKFNQPSNDSCLADLLLEEYGNITPEYIYRYVAPMLQTGSLHTAVYDYSNKLMYISNSGKWDPPHIQQKGYDRPFIRIDLEKEFNRKSNMFR